jgi:DNA-binding NarL/FixJ family response regulator
VVGSLWRRISALAATQGPLVQPVELTRREREIVRLIDQDLSNKEIACHLGVEVATVKNHVHNLLEKLGVHRRTEAARLFARLLAAHRICVDQGGTPRPLDQPARGAEV